LGAGEAKEWRFNSELYGKGKIKGHDGADQLLRRKIFSPHLLAPWRMGRVLQSFKILRILGAGGHGELQGGGEGKERLKETSIGNREAEVFRLLLTPGIDDRWISKFGALKNRGKLGKRRKNGRLVE